MLHLVKVNELAEIFVEQRNGFSMLGKLLKQECIKVGKDQIAYNVIGIMWVLSYHDFSYSYFSDYELNLIESVAKVLDYYNKEKIVRIVCMLFDVSLFLFIL